MWFFRKKSSPRRNQLRKNITAERLTQLSKLANMRLVVSLLIWLAFIVLSVLILSFRLPAPITSAGEQISDQHFHNVIPTAVIVILISTAVVFYVQHYQRRIIRNHTRALTFVGLFILLLHF